MLQGSLLLLLTIFSITDATPLACEKRFHRLYTNIDGKKSDCHLIKELRGFVYTIELCRITACKEGGNVINFKETEDRFDDNICQVLSCIDGDLKIIEDAEHIGFNVLLSDADEALQCTPANDRLLSCWTCDEENEEDCKTHGNFEPCLQEAAKCSHFAQTDARGVTTRVTRGCVAAEECTDSMWGRVGECEVTAKRAENGILGGVLAGCRKCGYGYRGNFHRCYPVAPQLEVARTYEGQRDWVQLLLNTDGKQVNCPLLAQEETGYSLEACQRLALAIGGNVVGHRYSEHCRVHRCPVTGAGVEDLQLTDIVHGWGIHSLARDIPCSYITDRTLSCFTCNEKSERMCWKKGNMQDCKDSDSVCLHQRRVADGVTVNVKRGCIKRSQCTESIWDPDYNAGCKYTTKGDAKICNTCLFGTHGKVHGCHAPFSKACIKNFVAVREDKTERTMTQSCIQVANQKNHWKKSCLNLACLANANVVHFSSGVCEVYNCQLEQGEEYIFRKEQKKNRNLKIFVSKK